MWLPMTYQMKMKMVMMMTITRQRENVDADDDNKWNEKRYLTRLKMSSQSNSLIVISVCLDRYTNIFCNSKSFWNGRDASVHRQTVEEFIMRATTQFFLFTQSSSWIYKNYSYEQTKTIEWLTEAHAHKRRASGRRHQQQQHLEI